ncbi:MAG TPA: hypothetical protein VGX49_14315 [Jatrophihabitans sp.]|jgi:hypothetical protein|nr:hypothetical protein [Jatrophihabitans sp.]
MTEQSITLSDYLPGHVRFFVLIMFFALLTVEFAKLPSKSGQLEPAGWLALTLAAAAVTVAVGRHILGRSQPIAAEDVLAADEAIRSRSLHVLAGAALAIIGYLGAAVLSLPGGGLGLLCLLGRCDRDAVAAARARAGLPTSQPPTRLARSESRELLGQ